MLFLGAGVSMNSVNALGYRPPSWHSFLEKGILRCPNPKKHILGHLRNGDYLTCCQLIKYRLGADWVPLVEEEFLTPNFLPAEIHKEIFNLDANIVLTPNFDKIYDNYAHTAASGNLKIKHYYDDDIVRVVRGNERLRTIIKIHGCIDAPDKLIFTREDYAKARIEHAPFYSVLDALMVTNTFVFIGCGMNDPDLSLILERYSYSFSSAPPHYILMPGPVPADYAQMLKNNYNISVICYSKKDNHQELTDSIRELATLVDTRRGELAAELLW